jgi:hypothetical protein
MVNDIVLSLPDWRLLGGLLDIFPFASDDLEARNAVWNVLARILVRIHETEMNSSSLCQFVSVLVRRIDLIEDELLNQECVDSSSASTTDARNTSVSFSFSYLGLLFTILRHPWDGKN